VTRNGKLTEIESNIYYLDSRKLSSFGVSGVYFVVGEGITLIETGTTLNARHILESTRKLGFDDKDIRNAIVTHIHLDHAGATGWLVRRLPHLKVYVHKRGLEHLRDPSKLIESAKTVYRNIETITAMHGEILPVPAGNLVGVTDTEIDAGNGVHLQIFDAPGHAYHHLCIYEPETGALFSGEALGHYEPETDTISTAVAPPAFDYEAALKTIDRIEALSPGMICFSQFGQHSDPKFVMDTFRRQLTYYYELILKCIEKGLNTAEIIEDIWHLSLKESRGGQAVTRDMLASVVRSYQIYFSRMGKLK